MIIDLKKISRIYPIKNLLKNKHGEKYVESNRTGNILFGIYIKKRRWEVKYLLLDFVKLTIHSTFHIGRFENF